METHFKTVVEQRGKKIPNKLKTPTVSDIENVSTFILFWKDLNYRTNTIYSDYRCYRHDISTSINSVRINIEIANMQCSTVWFMVNFFMLYLYVNEFLSYCITERIASILCMHLGACHFFTHPTALMHLKSILSKCIQLHFIFLAHTRIGSHWELL